MNCYVTNLSVTLTELPTVKTELVLCYLQHHPLIQNYIKIQNIKMIQLQVLFLALQTGQSSKPLSKHRQLAY